MVWLLVSLALAPPVAYLDSNSIPRRSIEQERSNGLWPVNATGHLCYNQAFVSYHVISSLYTNKYVSTPGPCGALSLTALWARLLIQRS